MILPPSPLFYSLSSPPSLTKKHYVITSKNSISGITEDHKKLDNIFSLKSLSLDRGESSRVFSDIPIVGPGYYIGIFGGKTAVMLGSNEKRTGFGFTFQYGENFPSLRFRKYPGELVVEMSFDYSHGGGFKTYGANDRFGFSILPMARWRGRPKDGRSLFIDLGLGLYFSDPTVDINSFISTQPTLDAGIDFKSGEHEWLIGLRLRHVSNGGTKGPNDGQNFIALFVNYRL